MEATYQVWGHAGSLWRSPCGGERRHTSRLEWSTELTAVSANDIAISWETLSLNHPANSQNLWDNKCFFLTTRFGVLCHVVVIINIVENQSIFISQVILSISKPHIQMGSFALFQWNLCKKQKQRKPTRWKLFEGKKWWSSRGANWGGLQCMPPRNCWPPSQVISSLMSLFLIPFFYTRWNPTNLRLHWAKNHLVIHMKSSDGIND